MYLLTEAAERTGLTVDALRKRIRRGRLETVKGNDGLVRVRLTSANMDALQLAEGQPRPSQADESGRTVAVLEAERDAARLAAAKAEGESATLREQVESERARAGKAEAERDAARVEASAERGRADRAEGERDAARAEREAARVAAAAEGGEARGLREALAEAWRPFWRRCLG